MNKISYIKIFGWLGAVASAIASILVGDVVTATGIIAAAAASSNLTKQ